MTTLPAPAGTQYTVVLPSQRGVLVYPSGPRIEVQSDSFETPFTLSARPMSEPEITAPTSYLSGKMAYQLGPDDITFDQPVQIMLPIPGTPTGGQPLRVARLEKNAWSFLTTYSPGVAGYLATDASRFSIYGLALDPGEAETIRSSM